MTEMPTRTAVVGTHSGGRLTDRTACVCVDDVECRCSVSNRRVHRRFPFGLTMLPVVSQVRLGVYGMFRRARCHDISQAGIALFMKDAPPIGTVAHVRLRHRLLNFTFDLPAVIVHITPAKRGNYRAGLVFTRELTLAEFEGLR